MSVLKVLRGLPASGKSTYADELVKSSGYNFVRVNRDLLRKMMFNSFWSQSNEKAIISTEIAIAESLLHLGKSVIIDDTNLTETHINMWKGLVNSYNSDLRRIAHSVGNIEECKLEIKSFLDVPIETCVERDNTRTEKEHIGQAIIHKMALKNGLISWPEKQIVIFDIDGTLANCDHRLKFVEKTPKDWNAFFKACWIDQPNYAIVDWCNALYDSGQYTVVIVSGRPTDKCQYATLRWLHVENVRYHYIFMRDGGNYKPDTEIKQEILNYLPKDKIAFVVDDRPSIIEMWRKNGIRVFPVNNGKEF